MMMQSTASCLKAASFRQCRSKAQQRIKHGIPDAAQACLGGFALGGAPAVYRESKV